MTVPQSFIHGNRLRSKCLAEPTDSKLHEALEAYEEWRIKSLSILTRTPDDIRGLVKNLNEYKKKAEAIFDARDNSAQEVLQPSILEEFMEYLFLAVADEFGQQAIRRPGRGYVSLVFHPKSMDSLLTAPEHTISRKDHDFVIGASVNISVSANGENPRVATEEVLIPAVAIECKRYLERNMLDECAGTAAKVKRATPYCLYIVVSEFLKMDDSSPELSKIDEIYILRKQKNSDRLGSEFVANDIDAELVIDLYDYVMSHLRRLWWDTESALSRGKIFNFK